MNATNDYEDRNSPHLKILTTQGKRDDNYSRL